MKTLVITEDVIKITTLSGKLGKIYSWLSTHLQKLKIKIILKTIADKNNTFLITSETLLPKTKIKVFFWDQILSQNQLEQERFLAWQITEQTISPYFKNLVFKTIPFIKVWQTYLAIHISEAILSYHQALDRLLNEQKPSRIIICGSSHQEKIIQLIARQKNIPVSCYHFPDFSKFNDWLLTWLHRRQLKLKLKNFISNKEKEINLPQSGSYLLATSFFRHLKTLVPLYQSLIKKGLVGNFVTDSSTTTEFLNNYSIPLDNYLSIKSYINQLDCQKIINSRKKLIRKVCREIQSQLPVNPQTIHQLTAVLLKSYLKSLIGIAFPLSCLYLEAGHRLIKKTKPKGLFIISDLRPLEVSLVLLAKKYKIPNLLVSPNTILSLDAINKYTLANQVTVVGPFIKNQLMKIGVPDKKINVVGDLRFNSLTSKKIQTYKQKVYQQLNLSPKTHLFLLVSFRIHSQIPLTEKRRFFEIASQAVKSIPHGRLIIKPHPTESKTKLLNQIKEWGITKAIVTDNQELELIKLLSACQILLLTWSMTGFEAMVLGRPVVVINPTNKDYDEKIPYVKNGGAQLAKSTLVLSRILNLLISNPQNYKRWVDKGKIFVRQYIKPIDHQVGKRIIKLIT